jgi:lipid II:glycine glycyltransferase (peptidoglycan interpeptide bridge formation enzyme)
VSMLANLTSLVRVEDHWFCESKSAARADIYNYFWMKWPRGGYYTKEEHTLIIDLFRTEKEIWNDLSKNCRYDIKRAERDGISYVYYENASSVIDDFIQAYSDARRNEWKPALPRRRLRRQCRLGNVRISCTTDGVGKLLTWHVYVHVSENTRILYSASTITDPASRTLRGRANRLHHWRDMQTFKQLGVRWYDFGGIYLGKEDQKQIEIAKFKSTFGRDFSKVYSGQVAATPVGALALFAKRAMARM